MSTALANALRSLGLAGDVDHPNFESAFASDARVFYNVDVDALTDGAQRLIVRAHLRASREVVFARVTDHEHLQEWMPQLERLVEIDHTHSETPGQTGVGTARTVIFGGDTVTEDFKGWEDGRCYAYSLRVDADSPVVDHLGVFTFEDDGSDGCYLTWRQFFNAIGFKGRVAPLVMRHIMRGALKNLIHEFEGEIVSVAAD